MTSNGNFANFFPHPTRCRHWPGSVQVFRKKPKKKKTNNCHCCVPMCNNYKRYDDSLSFHRFPANEQLRAEWLHKIRRDVGKFFQVSYPALKFSISVAFICTSLKP